MSRCNRHHTGQRVNSQQRCLSPSYPSIIVVGDGSALPITNMGSASLPTTSRSLFLLDILTSPQMIKKIISVCAFTHDSSVSVEFDPLGFSVKDLATKTVLIPCDSSGDLYPFMHPRQCLTPTVTSDQWHQLHGHPLPRPLLIISLVSIKDLQPTAMLVK